MHPISDFFPFFSMKKTHTYDNEFKEDLLLHKFIYFSIFKHKYLSMCSKFTYIILVENSAEKEWLKLIIYFLSLNF